MKNQKGSASTIALLGLISIMGFGGSFHSCSPTPTFAVGECTRVVDEFGEFSFESIHKIIKINDTHYKYEAYLENGEVLLTNTWSIGSFDRAHRKVMCPDVK